MSELALTTHIRGLSKYLVKAIKGLSAALVMTLVMSGGQPAHAQTVDCVPAAGMPCTPIINDTPGLASSLARSGQSTPGGMTGKFVPSPDTGASRTLNVVNVFTTNWSSYRILFKMFSKTRRWVWPSNTRWYISPNNGWRYRASILCLRGEKVCIGGFAPSRPGYYWGVGPQGNKGCSNCCFICRTGNFYTGFRN